MPNKVLGKRGYLKDGNWEQFDIMAGCIIDILLKLIVKHLNIAHQGMQSWNLYCFDKQWTCDMYGKNHRICFG